MDVGREPIPPLYQMRSRPADRPRRRPLSQLRDARRKAVQRGLPMDFGPAEAAMTDTGAGTPPFDWFETGEGIRGYDYDEVNEWWASRPATDPAGLDVERLATALWGMRWTPDAPVMARKIAAEYARLSVADGPGPEERP